MSEPTLWNRFVATLRGEIPATTVEAYHRASAGVYDALEHAETHRDAGGANAWALPAATRAEILCAWNAFVLQTLGDRFLEADYESDPTTEGFVPAVTGDQILQFYAQVEGWLNRAQQAHHNPGFVLDVAVPAELPPWSEVEPCPNAHLFGMLSAMKAVRTHTDGAIAYLDAVPQVGTEQEKDRDLIRQLHASTSTTARYAEEMMGGDPSRDVHERVEEHAKKAIEGYYLLGQLLAMPELARRALAQQKALAKAPRARSRTPMPGETGFDSWCLTDPDAAKKFKKDAAAREAIETLWALDPDPAETLGIQADIDAAFERGDIAYATVKGGRKLGHFFCAPWGSVYVVKKPITLGGTRLRTMQQFIFNVTCEGVNLGVAFEREILTANFAPTDRFEYGDPNEPPDH